MNTKTTKIYFTIISVCLLLFYNCEKKSYEEESITSKTSILNQNEIKLLNSKYPFKSFRQNINILNDSSLVQQIRFDLSDLIQNKQGVQLDFTNVLIIDWGDQISYAVNDTQNPNDTYVSIFDKTATKSSSKELEPFLITVDATSDGSGILSQTKKSETTTATFEKGILKKDANFLKRNSFRECFDSAYDSICDGFIGCLAWYTNTAIPITAMVYCQITK